MSQPKTTREAYARATSILYALAIAARENFMRGIFTFTANGIWCEINNVHTDEYAVCVKDVEVLRLVYKNGKLDCMEV